MEYHVRLTNRALRDLENIYDYIQAESSMTAHAWFNNLVQAIFSLEHLPNRGVASPGRRSVRHLLFGKKPDTYRVVYLVNARKNLIDVLHIRHGARNPAGSGKVR